MRISDWSSDVCSSDRLLGGDLAADVDARRIGEAHAQRAQRPHLAALEGAFELRKLPRVVGALGLDRIVDGDHLGGVVFGCRHFEHVGQVVLALRVRSEEHTSELQSLMRISYAVFCLKKKKATITHKENTT